MARKSPISSHESVRVKRKGEPWHTGPKSFPNYFYIDKETFRMVWFTCWVRNYVGWWERFCASVRDSDELQHSRPYRGASSASLCLTKCQERCFKASWSTFVKERISHNDFQRSVLLPLKVRTCFAVETSKKTSHVFRKFWKVQRSSTRVCFWVGYEHDSQINPVWLLFQWWMTLKEVFATGKFGIHTRFFCLYLLHQELVYGLDGSYQQNKHPMHLVTGQVHHSSCFGYEMGL